MAYVNRLLILLLFISANAYSIELVEIATKQNIENLRYVSSDGKHTLYQTVMGTLHYATNYKAVTILEKDRGTQYFVSASRDNSLYVIDANPDYYSNLSLRDTHEIYTFEPKNKEAKFIAKGNNPRIHLKNSYLSYFNLKTRTLHFKNLKGVAGNFSINLLNKVNPYFIPHVIMLDQNNVLYTDINKEGIQGIIHFNRKTKKVEPILKTSTQLEKIELCVNEENIFIGLFGLSNSSLGTSITYTNYKKYDFTNRKELYQSELNDIGNIKCKDKNRLYIVKRYNKKNQKNKTEVASIDIESKKVKKLSDLFSVSQIIEMDTKVLLPHMGKVYLIKGSNNLRDDKLEEIKKTKKGKKSNGKK